MTHNEISSEYITLKYKLAKAIKWNVCTKNMYYVRLKEWVGNNSPRHSFNGLDVVHGIVFNIMVDDSSHKNEMVKCSLDNMPVEALLRLLNIVENGQFEEWKIDTETKKLLNT